MAYRRNDDDRQNEKEDGDEEIGEHVRVPVTNQDMSPC